MKKQFLLLFFVLNLILSHKTQAVTLYDCSPVEGTNTCTATLGDDGVMTVSGTGAMADYTFANRAEGPFYKNMNIKTVIIEDGITHVGENIFSSCSNLEKIELADSVQTVGEYAFDNISNLQSVIMSDNTVWNYQDNLNDKDDSNVIKIYCRGDLEKCTENLSKRQLATFKGVKAVYKGKRIYTVDEANKVVGQKNKVIIRYK